MQDTAICFVLYVVLIVFDIVPQIRSKKWKPLWFVFTVYAATFILQALISFNIIGSNLVKNIEAIIKFLFRLK